MYITDYVTTTGLECILWSMNVTGSFNHHDICLYHNNKMYNGKWTLIKTQWCLKVTWQLMFSYQENQSWYWLMQGVQEFFFTIHCNPSRILGKKHNLMNTLYITENDSLSVSRLSSKQVLQLTIGTQKSLGSLGKGP